jgi:hypothetical protein
MPIQQSASKELEASQSPSREIEAFRSNANFDYDECVRRLATLVQSKDSNTLEETALLMGQLTSAIE